MGNHDTSKVIPLFPQSHSAAGAMSAYAPYAGDPLRETIYDHQLAHRRGSKPSSPFAPCCRRMALRRVTPYPRRKPAATR